ncbi:7660_t:CDS:2 [Funneliformis geosporum]|uniref:17399_t:CDS:1 n=1 Tax=Funneliformis geosporum TaxID=1117311 RepID=A0A9W4WLW3_9GLOM|nr:7660_t:CDS:2 [Funneliformis geosporum]CAI2163620.1 17399_t:CDS:2 [Funneliformis geosporum]
MSSEDLNNIKRRRVARACDTCRRKKVRCDGVQPDSDPPSCTNCKAYGYECAFIDAPKKRGPPKGYIEALETRLQRMESILGGLVQSGDLPEGTISTNLEWINVNESNFRSEQDSNGSHSSRLRRPSYDSVTIGSNLKNGRTNLSYSTKSLMTSSNYKLYKNVGQGSDSEECFSSDSNEYSGSQYDLDDSMGQLAIDESGHTSYLGNSSGIFLFKVTKKVANGQLITFPKPVFCKPTKGIETKMEFELPPREICDKLLDAYWKEFHPFMPFIDKQDLMEKYNNLEYNYFSVILLYSIFSISARFVEESIVRPDPNDDSNAGTQYFNKAKDLLKDEFCNASISLVQSLILLAGHRQSHKSSANWVYIGLAIRLAQDMGLHRDSAKWNLDERQGEIRRRVWWGCVLSDRYGSARMGRPLAINDADFDVDLPVAGKVPEDDEETIEGWVEIIKCNLILGRILNHSYCLKSKSSQVNVEQMLTSLDHELNEWRDNLPKNFLYDSTPTNYDNINSNMKVLLNLLFYNQQILLHRPHIRGPKSKAPPSSIPSLTICTMAANNITHILYRVMKTRALKFTWSYTIHSFFTAATMHIINVLSGDDRFREVAKHGLRMTLKCLEYMSEFWNATDKIIHIIRDLLKSRNIVLEGFMHESQCDKSKLQKTKTSSKKKSTSRYIKLEDMATEGTPRDENPFLNCLAYATFMNTSLENSPQSSTVTLPSSEAIQYEQTSSPESTTSSSSGYMSFDYLTAEGGTFPPNADAFNPDNPDISLIFDNIDDQMSNNNPFMSLPTPVDWACWTDWTDLMLRMSQGNPGSNFDNMTSAGSPNVVGNPHMQPSVTLGATTIPSMSNMTL